MEDFDELEAFQLFRDKICTVHLKDRRKEAKYPDDTRQKSVRMEVCHMLPKPEEDIFI
jgi:hypothetical protein